MESYSNTESSGFTATNGSLNRFRQVHPNINTTKDSVHLGKGVYKYSSGELNFDFSVPQYEITTIAWKTLKSSGVSASFDFKCLMYLEGLYYITNKVSIENEELYDQVVDFLNDEEASKEKSRLLT